MSFEAIDCKTISISPDWEWERSREGKLVRIVGIMPRKRVSPVIFQKSQSMLCTN